MAGTEKNVTLLSYLPGPDRPRVLANVDLAGAQAPKRGLTCYYGYGDGVAGMTHARERWPDLLAVEVTLRVPRWTGARLSLDQLPESDVLNFEHCRREVLDLLVSTAHKAWQRVLETQCTMGFPALITEYPDVFDAVFRSKAFAHLGLVIWPVPEAVKRTTGIRKVATLLRTDLVDEVYVRDAPEWEAAVPSIPRR